MVSGACRTCIVDIKTAVTEFGKTIETLSHRQKECDQFIYDIGRLDKDFIYLCSFLALIFLIYKYFWCHLLRTYYTVINFLTDLLGTVILPGHYHMVAYLDLLNIHFRQLNSLAIIKNLTRYWLWVGRWAALHSSLQVSSNVSGALGTSSLCEEFDEL